ncbi:MAG: YceI family protein [Bacteroidetes bacterium]|nr:YceI family protein [Bacteroidota bacterium]MDA1121626.1 YceI family protein [Bacteroidota bacterium]
MRIILILFFTTVSLNVTGQKYNLDVSLVSFYSYSVIEDISAENSESLGLIDLSTNRVAFIVPIIKFKFKKKLMQEHFNEKYMESELYPQATFQGTMVGFDSDALGKQDVSASGKLTIHGISQDVSLTGGIQNISDQIVNLSSEFKVKLEDYEIEIPQLLWQNIAEEIEVKVEFTFKLVK